jgi:homoserine O-acetyltransferase
MDGKTDRMTNNENTTPSAGRDEYAGSDECRSRSELRHAKTMTFEEPLPLTTGGVLPSVTVTYETYGTLCPARDNVVLVCHALTGDSHVAAHDEQDSPGWWDLVVGPGKAIDTDRYFVICSNVLGGCRGTTGPNSISPETHRPYGENFPTITIEDMVHVQARLMDELGIEKLLAVVGGSMGGHQALAWAKCYPKRVGGVVALATSPRLTSQSLAFDVVGRNAIRHDPHFHDGQYYGREPGPAVGLAIARMLGHITYLSPIAMSQKFEATRHQPRDIDTDFEKEFSVGTYLAYKGETFVERFDANSYLALSMAMDLFDLGAEVETLSRTLSDGDAKWLVVSFSSDWLFPPFQSKQIVHALLHGRKNVTYCNIESSCGHDAFLLEDDLPLYGGLVEAFLANIAGRLRETFVPEAELYSHTSIFHSENRIDYDLILDLIPVECSVLDAGCGSGGLLAQLKQRGHRELMGVELDPEQILLCGRRGLDVVQRDLNRNLKWFADDQFDVVVLSHTIQAVYDVEGLMDELLRVGRRCIVSVPNFGYRKLVQQLNTTGRTPASEVLPYQWFNTPNIRVMTLRDFTEFCGDHGIAIERMIALDTEADRELSEDEDPNRNADMAIFVLRR